MLSVGTQWNAELNDFRLCQKNESHNSTKDTRENLRIAKMFACSNEQRKDYFE